MTYEDLLRLTREAHIALYGDDSGYVPHDGDCPCETCAMERARDAAMEVDGE